MGSELSRTFSFRAKVISIVDQEVIDWSRLSAFTRTRCCLREELENGLACFAAQAFRRYHSSNFS
ncbi:hypothetical protein RESH_01329 [Rhodopirellula europaea SH398]|uniref:Uncharacterized protein n=2 Tax=Rhodopirellula europaea TaxID=1263866 RepID=M5S8Z4_9BACT|nr:hypothetical protein RE6C_01319 [Rhodopirellula europaea 6C]EMI28108.1 hypothetical protein RESH_01329 [Rhodopirellula europaea SH398]